MLRASRKDTIRFGLSNEVENPSHLAGTFLERVGW
jgi:hypothetical protein